MICETCRGAGWIEGGEVYPRWEPCPDCGGNGTMHCCEGNQACVITEDDGEP